MKKAIRVATICHNDDKHTDKNHRRVRLELHKDEGGYVWLTAEGEDCNVGICKTVVEAERNAKIAWGGEVWAMKSNW